MNTLKIVASADEYCTYMSLIEIMYDENRLKRETDVVNAVVDAAYEYCFESKDYEAENDRYSFCWADIDMVPDSILQKYGIYSIYSTLHPLQVDMCECIAYKR